MTPEASKSDDDDVSPAGKVYREMVSDMLAAGRDRRTNLEGRAGILFASSGTLLALVGGLAAFVVGKDHAFENRTAIIELCRALPWFVLSAVTALVVQTTGPVPTPLPASGPVPPRLTGPVIPQLPQARGRGRSPPERSILALSRRKRSTERENDSRSRQDT
jgi:hypothetical protein